MYQWSSDIPVANASLRRACQRLWFTQRAINDPAGLGSQSTAISYVARSYPTLYAAFQFAIEAKRHNFRPFQRICFVLVMVPWLQCPGIDASLSSGMPCFKNRVGRHARQFKGLIAAYNQVGAGKAPSKAPVGEHVPGYYALSYSERNLSSHCTA